MANQLFRQPIAGVPGSGSPVPAIGTFNPTVGAPTAGPTAMGHTAASRAAQFGKVAGPALGALGTAQTIAGASGDPTTDLLSGGASGAATGAMFGPVGAIIGGVLGAAGTAIMGGSKKRKAAKAAEKANRATAFNNLIGILQGRGTQPLAAQAPQIVGDPIGAAAGGLQALQGLQGRKTALADKERTMARQERKDVSDASLRALQLQNIQSQIEQRGQPKPPSAQEAFIQSLPEDQQERARLIEAGIQPRALGRAPARAKTDLERLIDEAKLANLLNPPAAKAGKATKFSTEGLTDVFEVPQ